jgi:hypothetical protein
MSSGVAITLYLAAAFLAGILGTIIARAKRRGPGFWMVACFLVPPLFIVLLLLPTRRFIAVRQRPSADSDSFDADNLDKF